MAEIGWEPGGSPIAPAPPLEDPPEEPLGEDKPAPGVLPVWGTGAKPEILDTEGAVMSVVPVSGVVTEPEPDRLGTVTEGTVTDGTETVGVGVVTRGTVTVGVVTVGTLIVGNDGADTVVAPARSGSAHRKTRQRLPSANPERSLPRGDILPKG